GRRVDSPSPTGRRLDIHARLPARWLPENRSSTRRLPFGWHLQRDHWQELYLRPSADRTPQTVGNGQQLGFSAASREPRFHLLLWHQQAFRRTAIFLLPSSSSCQLEAESGADRCWR